MSRETNRKISLEVSLIEVFSFPLIFSLSFSPSFVFVKAKERKTQSQFDVD